MTEQARIHGLRAVVGLALTAAIVVLGAGAAEAKTYKVKNTHDGGKGSLRKAINKSDKRRGRDKIRFAPGLSGEIKIRREQEITDPLRIVGNGDDDLVLSGALSGSRLKFTTNRKKRSRLAKLSLERVGIQAYGQGGDRGGLQVIEASLDGDNSATQDGIRVYRAPLTLRESTVTGYLDSGVDISRAPSEILDSSLEGNGANGILIDSSDLVVERSTLADNRGWGARADYGAFVALRNSTVSANGDPTKAASGGIDAEGGAFKIQSSTITANVYADNGFRPGAAMGGNEAGSITLANSIIADNSGHNCSPVTSYLSEGGNVYDEADGCDGITGKDKLADPALGPLADNGGPTRTHAIAADSPAIGTATGEHPDTDQRGVPRDSAPDSGAFELAGD